MASRAYHQKMTINDLHGSMELKMKKKWKKEQQQQLTWRNGCTAFEEDAETSLKVERPAVDVGPAGIDAISQLKRVGFRFQDFSRWCEHVAGHQLESGVGSAARRFRRFTWLWQRVTQ